MQLILEKRIIPISIIESVEEGLNAAEALSKADLPILEITLRTPCALEAVSAIRKRFPEMCVGAGTILKPEQVMMAHDAGARFGVAPGCNEVVVEKAKQCGMPFIPGIMTPSDVERGLALGCMLQKFFPAETAGGVHMLKALAGPYKATGVRFIPLGGVDLSNAKAYLDLPIVAAIGGSWLVARELIARGDWPQITSRAQAALALAAHGIA
jgi:2-dehydro-3-deoxyphosphogluconate aldolase / (4S)-4-hydroxy-2-oxoglutarate aldolase